MTLFVGTSGFSYKEWKGTFYPEKLPAADMLSYYAERLNAVEINNTFYRMPSVQLLEGWRAKVPDGFSFTLKASRRITHQKRLKEAGDPLSYLLETSQTLAAGRGPILFQLPPYLKNSGPRSNSGTTRGSTTRCTTCCNRMALRWWLPTWGTTARLRWCPPRPTDTHA